jgi:acyl dehydratase
LRQLARHASQSVDRNRLRDIVNRDRPALAGVVACEPPLRPDDMIEPIRSPAFEDFVPGEIVTFGAYEVTKEEIIAFASQFDPQPFHLDEAAGKASMLGGLAASGWHSCSIMMRMMFDGFMNGSTSLGSPGIDEVRWLKPVFPGDVLSVRREVLEARPSASKPDRGIVRFRFELMNQKGEVVMEQTNPILFGRRHPGAG